MNKVVVAGAGTGKTYALVQAYLFSLLGLDETGQAKRPHELLAVTFTEKAAAEMRTRIASLLLKISRQGQYDEALTLRAKELGVSLPQIKDLSRISRGLLSAPISTFHSFCAQCLREYAPLAQINPQFTLLEPTEEEELALKVAEQAILEALNEKEPGVGDLIARFQIRKAGDAKGLAESLVSLQREVQEKGYFAKDVPVYFEPKDKRMLLHNIQTHLDAFQNSPKLNALARGRLEMVLAAYQKLCAFYLAQEDEVALSALFRDLKATVSGRFGSDDLRRPLVQSITELGSFVCQETTQKDAHSVHRLLVRYEALLWAHKESLSVLGFGDLLFKMRQLLRENLWVRKQVKSRYRRILVDEFQDTSPLQEDLVALLCERRDEEQEIPPRQPAMTVVNLEPDVLFIVGDPKQSIYSFRGADVHLFERTLARVTEQEGQRENLTVCRRSQGAIVELVNQVAKATLPVSQDGVSFAAEDELSFLKSRREHAGEIWKADLKSEDDVEAGMAEALALGVKDLDLEPKDVVVLVRRIRSALPIVRALRQQGIPARVFGGDGFFERNEVMDFIAVLKLAVDPRDELATMTVLRSPFVNLNDNDIVLLLDQVEGWKKGLCWEQIRHAQSLRDLDLVIEKAKEKLGQVALADLLDSFLDETPYLDILGQNSDADEAFANLTKLKTMALSSELENAQQINRWWKALDNPPRESVAEPLDAETNAVYVMTIHQSKGLEFPVVVVADTLASLPPETGDILFDVDVGLAVTHKGRPISLCAPETTEEKKAFPTSIDKVRQRKRKRIEAELARLLYVSLTRAKDSVFVMDVLIDDEAPREQGISFRRLLNAGRELDADRFDELLPEKKIIV